jgi:hypothetical protein
MMDRRREKKAAAAKLKPAATAKAKASKKAKKVGKKPRVTPSGIPTGISRRAKQAASVLLSTRYYVVDSIYAEGSEAFHRSKRPPAPKLNATASPHPQAPLRAAFKHLTVPREFAAVLSKYPTANLTAPDLGYLINLSLGMLASHGVPMSYEVGENGKPGTLTSPLHKQHKTNTLVPATSRLIALRAKCTTATPSTTTPESSLLLIRTYLRASLFCLAEPLIQDSFDDRGKTPSHKAAAYLYLAAKRFDEDQPDAALAALDEAKKLGPRVRLLAESGENGNGNDSVEVPWLKTIHAANRCESRLRVARREARNQKNKSLSTKLATKPAAEPVSPNVVVSVLKAMASHPSDNNDDVYEALSNALVRRINFVTGATTMATLPPPDRNEVLFIGRSNVGKSSIVNMLCNRKALAYTSKRPGKTQQYNYFSVNDKPEVEREIKYSDTIAGERDDDSFYIVDPPGYGFAKVSDETKDTWSELM